MKIKFTEVTWYSQIAAVLIAVGIFGTAFYLGGLYYAAAHPTDQQLPVRGLSVSFSCAAGKNLQAEFSIKGITLSLPDHRTISLAKVSSPSGTRYSNADGSIVFLNSGKAASLKEGSAVTYGDCSIQEETWAR